MKKFLKWLAVPAGLVFLLGVVAACIGTSVAVPVIGAVGGIKVAVFALGLGFGSLVGSATKGWAGAGCAIVAAMILNTLVPGGWVVYALGSVASALLVFAYGGITVRLLEKVLDLKANARA